MRNSLIIGAAPLLGCLWLGQSVLAAPAEASAPDADPSADVQSASSAADSTRPAP